MTGRASAGLSLGTGTRRLLSRTLAHYLCCECHHATRFIHSEGDLRCPIQQTEQFYMRLKMMGKVPVELVLG